VPPDYLNSREDAILIWTVLILAFAFSRNGRAIAGSLWSVVCALFGKVLILFGLAAAYSAAVLILANRVGLFHASATREAVYWFFGVGLVLVTDELLSGETVSPRDLGREGIEGCLPGEHPLVAIRSFDQAVSLGLIESCVCHLLRTSICHSARCRGD
jgi:hypothetical protein